MKRAARGNCGEETYGQSCGQEENLPHVFWSASGVLTLVSSTPFASSHGGNNGSRCLGAPFPGLGGESCLYMGLLGCVYMLQNLFLPAP